MLLLLPSVSEKWWVVSQATILLQTGCTTFLTGAGITLAFAPTLVVPEFCFFSQWSLAVTKIICSAISASVSIWFSDNSINSGNFCVFSGSEFSLVVSTALV